MKKSFLAYALVIALFTLIIGCALTFTIDEPRYELIFQSGSLLWKSFFATIWISLVSLVGALIVGFALFVMNRSPIPLVNAFSTVFGEIIMGTPLLVMIFLVVYPLGQLIGSNNKLGLGILAMVLYNAPYIANAYQSTSAVVTEEQYMVMDLYDFPWYKRYCYVILPQMVKPFLPSLVNNLSSVIKSSALLNVIAVGELTYTTTVISSRNFAILEGYYVMWILYLAVTIPLSLLTKYLVRKVT